MTRYISKIIATLAPIVIASVSFGQAAYSNQVTTVAKNVPVGAQAPIYSVPNATILVCTVVSGQTCSTFTPIYSDLALTQPITQPLTADGQGRFTFYAASGNYTLLFFNPSGAFVGSQPISIGGGGSGCGGSCIQPNPTVTQTIAQPTGTSLQVSNLNGVLNASLFTGAEFGAKVMAAVTELAGTCGTIMIPRGSYTWSSQVTLPNCVSLQGNGAIVNVPVMTTPALVIGGTPVYNNSPQLYTPGQISNITFQGPGATNTSTIGVFYGRDGNAVWTPNTFLAFLTKFDNVHIRGFGTGLQFGIGFQAIFVGGVIENNNVGVSVQNNITGLENISFIGSEIINNVQQGMYFNQTGVYVELNLTNVSLDYNAQSYPTGSNLAFTNGLLNWNGGHTEGPTLPFVRILAPGAPATSSVSIQNVGFNLVNSTTSTVFPSFIDDRGLNTSLAIGPNNSFSAAYNPGATVTAVTNFSPVSGGNVNYFAQPYIYYAAATATTLNAYTGTDPNQYSIPVYNPTGGTLKAMVSNTQVIANGMTSTSGEIGIGATSGTPTSLTALDFYTNGTTSGPARIQTDGTQFSFGILGGAVLPISAAGINGQFWKPLASTTAPSGSCSSVNAGTAYITADGSFSYCDGTSSQWKKLYGTGVVPAYSASALTAGCVQANSSGVLSSTGTACGTGTGGASTPATTSLLQGTGTANGVQAASTGAITTTVNGVACALGATCTIPSGVTGTQYSPTYFSATNTAGGVTPFNGPAIFSTTGPPAAPTGTGGTGTYVGGDGAYHPATPLGTAAQFPVMNSGATTYVPVSMSGAGTLSSTGVLTLTPTGNSGENVLSSTTTSSTPLSPNSTLNTVTLTTNFSFTLATPTLSATPVMTCMDFIQTGAFTVVTTSTSVHGLFTVGTTTTTGSNNNYQCFRWIPSQSIWLADVGRTNF